jgi:hypothetical protein
MPRLTSKERLVYEATIVRILRDVERAQSLCSLQQLDEEYDDLQAISDHVYAMLHASQGSRPFRTGFQMSVVPPPL